MAPEREDLAKLRSILSNRFSEDELHDLCFDLEVDYDSLRGQGKAAKAGALVEYCYRRDDIAKLKEKVRELKLLLRESGRVPSGGNESPRRKGDVERAIEDLKEWLDRIQQAKKRSG